MFEGPRQRWHVHMSFDDNRTSCLQVQDPSSDCLSCHVAVYDVYVVMMTPLWGWSPLISQWPCTITVSGVTFCVTSQCHIIVTRDSLLSPPHDTPYKSCNIQTSSTHFLTQCQIPTSHVTLNVCHWWCMKFNINAVLHFSDLLLKS